MLGSYEDDLPSLCLPEFIGESITKGSFLAFFLRDTAKVITMVMVINSTITATVTDTIRVVFLLAGNSYSTWSNCLVVLFFVDSGTGNGSLLSVKSVWLFVTFVTLVTLVTFATFVTFNTFVTFYKVVAFDTFVTFDSSTGWVGFVLFLIGATSVLLITGTGIGSLTVSLEGGRVGRSQPVTK